MRYKFAHEGINTVLDRKFEVDSLKWDDDQKLVINWGNRFGDIDNVVGHASDVRRESDGSLTAEVEWYERGEPIKDEVNKEGGSYLTIYANEVVFGELNETKDHRHIKSARLRALFLTTTGEPDPWASVAVAGRNPGAHIDL